MLSRATSRTAGGGAAATIVALLVAGAALAAPKAKAKGKGGTAKPATAVAPASGAASAAPGTGDAAPDPADPRPLFATTPRLESVIERIEFALRPACAAGLSGAALDACKKNLPAEAAKAKAELEGKLVRLEVYVQRREYDAARKVYDLELGKAGVLRAGGLTMEADVAIHPSALATPMEAGGLADFGVRELVVQSEKYETEEDAADSPLGGFTRGSGWAVVKIRHVGALSVDCPKTKTACPSYPVVLVDLVAWAAALGSGKAVLDGKIVPEFGVVVALAAAAGAEPAKAPGTSAGDDTITAGGTDKIDAMLDDMKSGSGTTAAPVAGTKDLDPKDVTRVINDRKWRFKKCAAFGEGSLEYEFVIEVDGKVKEAKLKNKDLRDTPLDKCVLKILLETVFPAHKGPAKKLTYPLIVK